MTLKTPLCEKDMFTGTLCQECKKKLETKQITETDIEVSLILAKLSKAFPLNNVEFKKAIDLEKLLVLACTGKIGSLIGKQGKIVSEISKQSAKTVRIIEHTKDEKKMIQDLIGNARILAVKKTFNPQSLEFTIIIAKADKSKLIAPQESIEKGLQNLLNANTKIDFQ